MLHGTIEKYSEYIPHPCNSVPNGFRKLFERLFALRRGGLLAMDEVTCSMLSRLFLPSVDQNLLVDDAAALELRELGEGVTECSLAT